MNDEQDRRARRRRRLRTAAAGAAAALAVGVSALTVTAASAGTGAATAGGPGEFRVTSDIPNPGPGFRVKYAYWVKEGVQTYPCLANPDGSGTWGAKSTPEATLYPYGFLPPIHHFAGPRWQAKDGSTLLGTVRTSVPKDGTIPWLLLDVTHEGSGRQLADVTNISRVHTRGGVGPTGACTPGETRKVPYGADYLFWTAR